MPRVVATHVVSPVEAEAFLAPRDDLVVERLVVPGRFEADGGPFSSYLRTVELRPDGDRAVVEERIEFAIDAPFWRLLVGLPMRRALGRWPRPTALPWWHPPDRFDRRSATVLALLCSIAIVGGYLGTLITQTITFAADEFGASRTDQGAILAVTRVGVLVAVVLGAVADRRGRRRVLGLAAAAGCVVTATGALAPTLPWLGVSQVVARGFAGALLLLVGIVSAEEMPKNSRAWAFSLITMTAALGAGMCVWLLPLADLAPWAWRLLYVVPVLGLPLTVWVVRRLPESRRFQQEHVEAEMAGHGRRFWLLAVSGFMLAVFAAPATQFLNEFLRDERNYSAADITIFVLVTSTPGGIGILAGGRLADLRGRRLIGAIGILGGTLAVVVRFGTAGAVMWLASIVGTIIGGLVVPALGVYRPELFPTSLRGRAAGVLELIALAGSSAGLLAVGYLADRWNEFAWPMAIMAGAPLIVVVLVLTVYPETAHRSLEELNPEDHLTNQTSES
ncbi:MAG: MFS transporter [Acidimicrobiales bacterium]